MFLFACQSLAQWPSEKFNRSISAPPDPVDLTNCWAVCETGLKKPVDILISHHMSSHFWAEMSDQNWLATVKHWTWLDLLCHYLIFSPKNWQATGLKSWPKGRQPNWTLTKLLHWTLRNISRMEVCEGITVFPWRYPLFFHHFNFITWKAVQNANFRELDLATEAGA